MYSKDWFRASVFRMRQIISEGSYKRVVLQIPSSLLSFAFALTVQIRTETIDVFILHDSLKNSCCLDILGAEHLSYDCLIHFGEACFSSLPSPHHYYIFDPSTVNLDLPLTQHFWSQLSVWNIGYILVEQSGYLEFKNIFNKYSQKQEQYELLKLGQNIKGEQYFIFGYYIKKYQCDKNLLIISCGNDDFISNITLSMTYLTRKIGKQIFSLEKDGNFRQIKNQGMQLSKRYSLISKLRQINTFGLIICNPKTAFWRSVLERMEIALKKKKKFLFIMNNLNEVKLGNFAQIEAYIIITCFKHSLYMFKDFHRVLVTPLDVLIALEDHPLDQYYFDFNIGLPLKTEQEIEKFQHQQQLIPVMQGQIMLQSKLQTIDFYRQRNYKGLVYADTKQIPLLKKGKIGTATGYTALEQ